MVKDFSDIGVDPLIPEYPYGSDITILNTMYKYPSKIDKNKYDDGSITIVFRDNVTKEIKHHIIKNPPYVFYTCPDIDPNDPNEYPRLYMPRELLQQHVVPYKDLEYNIALENNAIDTYKDNIRMGNRHANKLLHTMPNVLNSDMDINNHMRLLFDKMYANTPIVPITKSFFDIEADTIRMAGDFPELGECPINAISFLNEYDNSVHTFLLRDEKNPLIKEFEDSLSPALFKELKDFVISSVAVGDPKNVKKYGIDNLNFNIYFFDFEIDLIRALYRLIHKLKPMYLLAWNNAFDTPYIVERVKVLGYDPADIMCDADFEVKFVRYNTDETDFRTGDRKDFEERCDYYDISMTTVVLDQMIQFASRRKNGAQINSYHLDDIGEMIAKVNKLDYSNITESIAMLPYLDYKTFVFYNVMDVIVQKCIENRTQDLEYISNKCLINNTKYCKGHRQTVYLVNRFTKEFDKEGFIIGNNCNQGNTKEAIRGALVGDPSMTNDYSKLTVRGQIVNVCDNLVDFDYKSMHPSMTLQNNMSPNSQIGCIEIPEQIYEFENRFGVDKWHRQEDFAEAITTQNIIVLCSRWFGLADYKTLRNDIIEYFITVYGYQLEFGKLQSCFYRSFHTDKNAVRFHPNWAGQFMQQAVAFHGHMPDMSYQLKEVRKVAKMNV